MPFSASNLTDSATTPISSIASSRRFDGSSILVENFSSGIFCSLPSASIKVSLNVLVVSPFILTMSWLSFWSIPISKVSEGFALRRICLNWSRFIAILVSFSTLYSTKALASIRNITIATFAGSIAMSSILFLSILILTSLTNSEIILMLSLSNLGSASTNFIFPIPKSRYIFFIVMFPIFYYSFSSFLSTSLYTSLLTFEKSCTTSAWSCFSSLLSSTVPNTLINSPRLWFISPRIVICPVPSSIREVPLSFATIVPAIATFVLGKSTFMICFISNGLISLISCSFSNDFYILHIKRNEFQLHLRRVSALSRNMLL